MLGGDVFAVYLRRREKLQYNYCGKKRYRLQQLNEILRGRTHAATTVRTRMVVEIANMLQPPSISVPAQVSKKESKTKPEQARLLGFSLHGSHSTDAAFRRRGLAVLQPA